MKKVTYTDTDAVALLIGRQFIYGSEIQTIQSVLLTQKTRMFFITESGKIIENVYADMITAVYTK